MLEGLTTVASQTLHEESQRLEHRIIDGGASDRDIDLFVLIACELGRRVAVLDVLDAVVDPRD